MTFDIDNFLSEPIKKKIRLKDKNVESEYSGVNPDLKAIIESSPKPLTITSGKRTPEENRLAGGVPNSFHQTGDALDIRKGELNPETRSALISKGFEVVSEPDHEHIEPSKNYSKKESIFDIDSFLKEDAVPEDNIQNKDGADSPLSIGQRAKMGFGNKEGILDYLNKIGKKGEYEDGQLQVDGVPSEPNLTDTLVDLGKSAVNPLRNIENLSKTPEELKSLYKNRRDRVFRDVKDLPADIAESPSDIMNIGLTSGGAALGALGGPWAPVTSPLGGAVGGLGSEKLKEAIGKRLGVYKTGGEFLTPEAKSEAAWGTLAGAPAVWTGLKKGKNLASGKLKSLLKSSELPEKIYANATGLGDTLLDEPDVVRTLLKEDVKGSGKTLRKVAGDTRGSIGKEINKVLGDKTFNYDELAPLLPDPDAIAAEASSGQRASAKSAANKVLKEFKDKFIDEEDILDPVYGNKIGKKTLKKLQKLVDLNEEKIADATDAARVYESEGAKGTARQKAQKELADTLRPFIEERVEGIRPLNKRYNVYKKLEKGIEKTLNKDYKGNPLVAGGDLKNWIASLLLGGTTGGKTRLATKLSKYANEPIREVAKPSLFSYPATQALIKSMR